VPARAWLVLLCAAAACSVPSVRFTEPDGGAIGGCPSNTSCAPVCGNAVQEDGEACDDGVGGAPHDSARCNATCTLAACGDGYVNPAAGEACDHGAKNGTAGDLCTAACKLITCGNGVVDAGEGCDDGAANGPGKRCNAMCRTNVCGDGDPLIGVEACDDGAGGTPRDTATCDSDCTRPACGDGHLNTAAGEVCDHGVNNGKVGDACSTTCHLVACGNGVVEQGEECDDGATNGAGQRCNAACKLNVCGDGDTRIGVEQCDGGSGGVARDTATCDRDCTLAVCGDAYLNPVAGEECDHGVSNGQAGDTCSATCHVVRCGNGLVEQGEQCDDGNATNGDACENDCTLPRCGNGIVDGGEQCDDGNAIDTDACHNNCTAARHYVCGYAIAGFRCDNGRDHADLFADTMSLAVAACHAVQPPATPDFCYVIDFDGATASDPTQCAAAGGTWRPTNSCCNFLGTLSCP
jgi:cysteine-rich repeat protein